ncbi:glycoside hydrolase family 65 protein [Thermicanus aegyptius]|uniref:glycoside hydrolase family 65 protein n=1 Tax=Thermicanus aegyptius TaxID=94009 RepID=UPI000413DE63|nr:glycoside hydrolase family 65 protein [Thermicanus aegyptius]
MKKYIKVDEWKIIEEGFDPKNHLVSESLFSLGNGHMGQRANFEETYSGESLQGSYMAGVYYPDKTRVGWWKIGYPEYFAKVINSTNWIGLRLLFDGEELDLARVHVKDFTRILNMKEGYLERNFIALFSGGREVEVNAIRFLSIARPEIGVISYSIKPLNFSGNLKIILYLDGDVRNQDANYDEKFWVENHRTIDTAEAILTMRTKKLDFYLTSAMRCKIIQGNQPLSLSPLLHSKEKYLAYEFNLPMIQGERTSIEKYVANVTSRDYPVDSLENVGRLRVQEAFGIGYSSLLEEQREAWAKKWQDSDIVIEGDSEAQQGIRFNIFQLHQTYTGDDPRLNIGPKGFTGEKYGGSTYWDTEAYCLPFYLSTADSHIARNLLLYRYNHLEKAKENARKLGFKKGALYPMVTMNGEECHNEWEITFEEIHRNGAIAYAIYNYVHYTGDNAYLPQYGLEVLIEISRFWEERIQYTEHKGYVILGVTGPNEYENNVNNNWYTNRIAAWTLQYTLETLEFVRKEYPERYEEMMEKTKLREEETEKWKEMIEKMYYPVDENRGIFLQQDGFLDKELKTVDQLDPKERPINQHWSWDRILRSCYIKQADVLQGLFFLGDQYDLETKRRNFDFYEPMTVHESSLSPCVHSILASELGYKEKAYELYLRTARLDLENYNHDTEDGLHITSMAGTWMSVVMGFGGLRVRNGRLVLNPYTPDHWKGFSFKILFRGSRLKVTVTKEKVLLRNETETPADLLIFGNEYTIGAQGELEIALQQRTKAEI